MRSPGISLINLVVIVTSPVSMHLPLPHGILTHFDLFRAVSYLQTWRRAYTHFLWYGAISDKRVVRVQRVMHSCLSARILLNLRQASNYDIE